MSTLLNDDSLKHKKRELSAFYLRGCAIRKFSNIKFYQLMEHIINTSNFSVIFYLIIITIEYFQVALIIWSYMDSNTVKYENASIHYQFNDNISQHLFNLGLNQKIRKYLLPYFTFINFFSEIQASMTFYMSFSLVHLALEISFFFLVVFLVSENIRRTLFGKLGVIAVQYRMFLSLHMLTIIEFACCFVIYRCNAQYNDLLNGEKCYSDFKYYIVASANCLNIIIKLFNIIIFSLFYQDYSAFSRKLPWSSPYNLLMLLQNIFKIFLVICILFINSPQLSLVIKAFFFLIYQALYIENRLKCPMYYSNTVSKLKFFLEGFIIAFIVLNYGYIIFSIFFWESSNIGSIDFLLLLILSFFIGLIYEYGIELKKEIDLFHFFDNLVSKNKGIKMYDLYVHLCDLEYITLLSRRKNEFVIKLFEHFSSHFEVCIEESCFCKEMKSLLLNKEVVFKQNKITEYLITVTQNDFCFADESDRESEKNKISEDNASVLSGDDAVVKFIEIERKNENLKKSNDKIFWGKFISKICMNYLVYNKKVFAASNLKKNENLAKNGKNNNFFFSLLSLDEMHFELVKIEYANIIMYLMNNAMDALTEANLIPNKSQNPLVNFIYYFNISSIFQDCFSSITLSKTSTISKDRNSKNSLKSEILGVEMKNLLLYNKLFHDILTSLLSVMVNAKYLWLTLMRRLFNINTIENYCKKIREFSIKTNTLFSEITSINGLTTTSQDVDYKVYKIYSYYLKKVWKNEDESNFYIKKALDEIYSTFQIRNSIKAPRFEDNFCQDVTLAMSVFFGLNRTGIVILNGNMSTDNFCKVSYVNDILWKQICEFTSPYDILGKNISILMPDFIGSCHDGYIKHFFQTSQIKIVNCVRCNFLLDKNKLFVPVKFLVKFLPSISQGVNFIGYITRSDFNDVVVGRSNKVGYILTDIEGKILFFDKICKNNLKLKSNITYNVTKLPEDDFYIHYLFPELLNMAKLSELKHSNSIKMMFNEYAVKKFIRTHTEDLNDADISVQTGNTLLSVDSPKCYKVGLIDKTLWNFDTKYQNSIKSFNKMFNIFYILFDKDPNEDEEAVLEEIHNKENKNSQDDETENISSMVSSINVSSSGGGNATNVNIMLSSIKTSLIANKYPTVLKLIGSIFIILVVIIVSITISDCAYYISHTNTLKELVEFLHLFYLEEYAIFSIHFRLSIMMLELFEYTDHKYYSFEINGKNQTYIKLFYSQIQDIIEELTIIQSKINKKNKVGSLQKRINSYLKEKSIEYLTYFTEDSTVSSTVSLINFQLDHSQNIARILRFIENENSELYNKTFGKEHRSNYICNYYDTVKYGYYEKDEDTQDFIVNSLSAQKNFNMFSYFFMQIFSKLIDQDGRELMNEMEKFLLWVTIAICIFFIVCYFVVFVILYMLTFKIYSICVLLVSIPYHYLEDSLNDVIDLEKNFDTIINDDIFFITNVISNRVIETGSDKKRIPSDAKTNVNSETSSNVKLVISNNTKTKEQNLLLNHPQHDSRVNIKSNYNEKEIKSKNDEKFLKYDPYYQKKQLKKIKYDTFKNSINLEIIILIAIYIIFYLFMYLFNKKKIENVKETAPQLQILNNLRFNIPMIVYDSQMTVINSDFLFDFSFTPNIIYNFTSLNNYIQTHLKHSKFIDLSEYYNKINSFNVKEICSQWEITYETAYTENSFLHKLKELSFCLKTFVFNNGIELGSMRVSSIIRGKNTGWSNAKITDQLRDIIIGDEVIKKIKEEITFFFTPLFDELMRHLVTVLKYELSKCSEITKIKGLVVISISIFAIIIYFAGIQRRYFSHFMNNKIMILLIPSEFLKKNKKHLINYI